MSVFEVGEKTIDRICSLSHGFIVEKEPMYLKLSNSCEDCTSLGVRMIELNKQAWEERYPKETSVTVASNYDYPLKKCTVIEGLKACEAWLYQCSDSPFCDTALWKDVSKLAEEARRHIVSNLEAYNAVGWGG